MTTYRFEEVWARREQSGKCPTCGKRTVRKYSDFMTVNPFNKNPDGTVKTRGEVRAAVEERADRWTPNFEHQACAEGRGVA